MRLNLTPFIDLFSILSIGMLVVMAVASGSEAPETIKPSYSIVVFYLGNPSGHEGSSMHSIANIEPYYIVNGVVREVNGLAVSIDLQRSGNSITIMIRGKQDNLSVGFKVVKLFDQSVLLKKTQVRIVSITSGGSKVGAKQLEKSLVFGRWNDPVVNVF